MVCFAEWQNHSIIYLQDPRHQSPIAILLYLFFQFMCFFPILRCTSGYFGSALYKLSINVVQIEFCPWVGPISQLSEDDPIGWHRCFGQIQFQVICKQQYTAILKRNMYRIPMLVFKEYKKINLCLTKQIKMFVIFARKISKVYTFSLLM